LELPKYIKGHYVVVGLAVMKVKETVNTWVCEQPKTFFASGVRTHVEDFKKCVELQGECVGK